MSSNDRAMAERSREAALDADTADYTPLRQLGAGRDGRWLLAERGGVRVHVHVLDRAGEDAGRMEEVRERLAKVRLVDHPNLLAPLEARLDGQLPEVVLPIGNGEPLRRVLAQGWRPSYDAALSVGIQIADALAAAHRVGLFIGGLSPAKITLDERRRVTIDPMGLETWSPASRSPDATVSDEALELRVLDVVCNAPETRSGAQPARAAHDVWSLGAILHALLTHRPPGVRGLNEAAAEDLGNAARVLLRGLLNPAPDNRLTAAGALDRLGLLLDAERRARGRDQSDDAGTIADSVGLQMHDVLAQGTRSTISDIAPAPLPMLAAERLSTVEPGMRLGRFDLLEVIGAGGMGEVAATRPRSGASKKRRASWRRCEARGSQISSRSTRIGASTSWPSSWSRARASERSSRSARNCHRRSQYGSQPRRRGLSSIHTAAESSTATSSRTTSSSCFRRLSRSRKGWIEDGRDHGLALLHRAGTVRGGRRRRAAGRCLRALRDALPHALRRPSLREHRPALADDETHQ